MSIHFEVCWLKAEQIKKIKIQIDLMQIMFVGFCLLLYSFINYSNDTPSFCTLPINDLQTRIVCNSIAERDEINHQSNESSLLLFELFTAFCVIWRNHF